MTLYCISIYLDLTIMHSFLNLFHAAIVKKSLKYVDPKVELWIKKPLKDALREKKIVFGVILVRIFPTFSHIRSEYGDILRIKISSSGLKQQLLQSHHCIAKSEKMLAKC